MGPKMGQRRAVTKKMAAAYRRGTRAKKTVILDTLVELTGWHRDHARLAYKGADTIKLVRPRQSRSPSYPAHLTATLMSCGLSRFPVGKRLTPAGVPVRVPW